MLTYLFTFEEIKDRKDALKLEEIVESDGSSTCKCDYRKNTAVITTSADMSDLYADINDAGYEIVEIEMI